MIAIGTKVNGFLKRRKLKDRFDTCYIPHYSTVAASHRGSNLEGTEEEFKKFAAQVEGKTWAQIITENLPESDLREWKNIDKKPTEWEKRVLLDYKLRFERIKQDNSR